MLVQAAKACNVDFRVSHRKGVPVVYVKEGEPNRPLLNMAGAFSALLTLELSEFGKNCAIRLIASKL